MMKKSYKSLFVMAVLVGLSLGNVAWADDSDPATYGQVKDAVKGLTYDSTTKKISFTTIGDATTQYLDLIGLGSGITPDVKSNVKWGDNNFAGKGEITAADVAAGGIYYDRGISAGTYDYKDATAWGEKSIALQDYATAFGLQNTASGQASVAMGFKSTAEGNYSLAAGYGAKTTGGAAIALGTGTFAKGYAAIALGQETEANTNAVALGYKTKAEAKGSTAVGYGSDELYPMSRTNFTFLFPFFRHK